MKKKQLLISIFGICFIFIVIIGLSYSYYIANPYGNDTMSNTGFTTDYLKLTYNGSSTVSGYILSPDDTLSTSFTVYNDSEFDVTSYDVYFSNVINKYNYYNYLVWTLSCTSYDGSSSISGTCSDVTSETIAPLKSEKMITASALAQNWTHKYVLTVKYKESGFNQATDKGKEFSTDITVVKKTGFLSYDALGNEGGSSAIIAKGTPNFSNIASTNEGMYTANDQDGRTYYYRGSANNYVSFAGKVWRIIRINGDGTIRLILDDYAKDTNSSYITTPYNSSSNCSSGNTNTITKAVECAKYGSGDYSATSVQSVIDTWYTNNITGTNDDYVATGKYCNDYSYYPTAGDYTYFSGVARLLDNKTPSLLCAAYSGYSGGGVSVISAKAGLVNSDELVLAGGKWNTANSNIYYYKDTNEWLTMTPMTWYSVDDITGMFNYSNILTTSYTSASKNIKPVINLDSNIIVSGLGTSANPYTVETKYVFSSDGTSEEPDNTSTLKYKILANESGESAIYARSLSANYASVSSDNGMYVSYDNDGPTFFYRGSAIPDNYVSFIGKTWRIVRINGDGTIRIMLNTAATNTSGVAYSIAYNSACSSGNIDSVSDAEECLKFGYGTFSATSLKNTVNTWYTNNITGANLNYVTSSKYCNEYSLRLGTTSLTAYYTNFNLKHTSITTPDHTCSNEITLNAGILSAVDAINYFGVNTTGGYTANYPTMTGYYYYLTNSTNNNVYVYNSSNVTANLQPGNLTISTAKGFLPVVNLKANVTVTGNGLSANPYVVSGLA